jgi:hypothetical protein
MEHMTEDELAEEIERRKEQLQRQRHLIRESVATMKKLRMIEELKDLEHELESETSSSTSSSSSTLTNASSSATSTECLPVADNVVAAIALPKPKNGMLAYWAVKDKNVPDVEVVNRRINDAQLNSESRQTEHHCSPAPYGHVRSPYVRSVFRTAPANS